MLDFPRWKITSIVAFLVALMLLAVPSFFPEEQTAKWPIPHPRVNLGLDLAGGSYLLLEADTKALARSRLAQMRAKVLTEMRRTEPRIGIGGIRIRGGWRSTRLNSSHSCAYRMPSSARSKTTDTSTPTAP